MKALTVKEPYATLIYNGLKTIETRTWCTQYRGPILLTASKNPKGFLSGKAFATAELVECRPMTTEDKRYACCDMTPRRKSWILRNIKKINPFPIEGKLGLFEVKYNG